MKVSTPGGLAILYFLASLSWSWSGTGIRASCSGLCLALFPAAWLCCAILKSYVVTVLTFFRWSPIWMPPRVRPPGAGLFLFATILLIGEGLSNELSV